MNIFRQTTEQLELLNFKKKIMLKNGLLNKSSKQKTSTKQKYAKLSIDKTLNNLNFKNSKRSRYLHGAKSKKTKRSEQLDNEDFRLQKIILDSYFQLFHVFFIFNL